MRPNLDNSYLVPPIIPDTRHKEQGFLEWMEENLFPAVTSLGPDGIRTLRGFHGSLDTFNLPHPYAFAEVACTKDFVHANYHVIFHGDFVGITAVQ